MTVNGNNPVKPIQAPRREIRTALRFSQPLFRMTRNVNLCNKNSMITIPPCTSSSLVTKDKVENNL